MYIKDKPSDFPYSYQKSVLTPDGPDVMYHWHPELELIYIEKGSARFHINEERFISKPGDIIVIQPAFLHAIQPLDYSNQVSKTFKIHLDQLGRATVEQFSQRYLQPLHTGLFWLTPRLQEGMAGYTDIKGCLLDIFQLVNDQSLYYDLLLKAKLHELLYYLFKNRHVSRHYTDDNYHKYEKLKDLISYINDHLDQHLTIDFLADYFGYSRNHFMAIFKNHTGSSCLNFILQCRLNKACEYLTQTDLAISEIAKKVGFDNLSNFNRQFKQRLHLTPLQYRKNKRKTT